MAFADPAHETHEDDLNALRREIGQLLFDTPGQQKVKKIGLRESFAIWQLDPEHFISASPAMPVKPSAFRHYQVYLDGTPRAHAIVQEIDGKVRIYDVEVSALAKRIDRAIEWIDKQDKDRNPVHYLVAYCCRVFAFRIVDADVVYVVSAPPPGNDVPEDKQLRPKTIVSTTEFLKRLRRLYETTKAGRSSNSKY